LFEEIKKKLQDKGTYKEILKSLIVQVIPLFLLYFSGNDQDDGKKS